jgi:hypothetical protein
MAPIYDSDVAEERWSQSEWSRYELWEKVEHRLRRNKRFWIGLAVLIFLSISSIPVAIDQRPRWAALSLARELALEINRLKLDASLQHQAYRIRFDGPGSLDFVVEKAESCSSAAFEEARKGALLSGKGSVPFQLLNRQKAGEAGIPGVVTEFCYDPLQGNSNVLQSKESVGFAIAPANDLTANRFDRLAILLVSGPSAEVSFD